MIPLNADEIMILVKARDVLDLHSKMTVGDSIGAYRVHRAHAAVRAVLKHGVLVARSNTEPRNGV